MYSDEELIEIENELAIMNEEEWERYVEFEEERIWTNDEL